MFSFFKSAKDDSQGQIPSDETPPKNRFPERALRQDWRKRATPGKTRRPAGRRQDDEELYEEMKPSCSPADVGVHATRAADDLRGASRQLSDASHLAALHDALTTLAN
jgi:hypothetical protein